MNKKFFLIIILFQYFKIQNVYQNLFCNLSSSYIILLIILSCNLRINVGS